tara:strand:- start:412 stop:969 length:558 start_codon:yes stop_codon:yes gene_type:complete
LQAIENILSRNSVSKLEGPHPSPEEMDLVYKSALRAPDHRWLRPSEFIEVTGDGLKKLSKIFETYANDNIEDITDIKLEKYKNAPFRAPMIIILISNIKIHPKVPEIEQMLSTAAAAQNILLTLSALGYGAIWRTGAFALNDKISNYFDLDDSNKILGYIYTGKSKIKPKEIPDINIDKFVTKWS